MAINIFSNVSKIISDAFSRKSLKSVEPVLMGTSPVISESQQQSLAVSKNSPVITDLSIISEVEILYLRCKKLLSSSSMYVGFGSKEETTPFFEKVAEIIKGPSGSDADKIEKLGKLAYSGNGLAEKKFIEFLPHVLKGGAMTYEGMEISAVPFKVQPQVKGELTSKQQKPTSVTGSTESFVADPNMSDKDGYAPLTIAVITNDVSVVKELLEKGADPDTMGDNGDSVLLTAVENDNIGIVTALLDKGAKSNILNNGDAITPLMQAVLNNNTGMVKLLLENGADPSIANSDRKTALDYCKNETIKEIINESLKKLSSQSPAKPRASTLLPETKLFDVIPHSRRQTLPDQLQRTDQEPKFVGGSTESFAALEEKTKTPEALRKLVANPEAMQKHAAAMAQHIVAAFKEEYLRVNFNVDPKDIEKNARGFARFYNKFQYLIEEQIINVSNIQEGADILEKWIWVANACLEKKEVNSLMAILTILDGTNIYRLDNIKNKVSSEAKEIYKKLQDFSSLKKHEELIVKTDSISPLLPYVPAHMSGIEFAKDDNAKKEAVKEKFLAPFKVINEENNLVGIKDEVDKEGNFKEIIDKSSLAKARDDNFKILEKDTSEERDNKTKENTRLDREQYDKSLALEPREFKNLKFVTSKDVLDKIAFMNVGQRTRLAELMTSLPSTKDFKDSMKTVDVVFTDEQVAELKKAVYISKINHPYVADLLRKLPEFQAPRAHNLRHESTGDYVDRLNMADNNKEELLSILKEGNFVDENLTEEKFKEEIEKYNLSKNPQAVPASDSHFIRQRSGAVLFDDNADLDSDPKELQESSPGVPRVLSGQSQGLAQQQITEQADSQSLSAIDKGAAVMEKTKEPAAKLILVMDFDGPINNRKNENDALSELSGGKKVKFSAGAYLSSSNNEETDVHIAKDDSDYLIPLFESLSQEGIKVICGSQRTTYVGVEAVLKEEMHNVINKAFGSDRKFLLRDEKFEGSVMEFADSSGRNKNTLLQKAQAAYGNKETPVMLVDDNAEDYKEKTKSGGYGFVEIPDVYGFDKKKGFIDKKSERRCAYVKMWLVALAMVATPEKLKQEVNTIARKFPKEVIWLIEHQNELKGVFKDDKEDAYKNITTVLSGLDLKELVVLTQIKETMFLLRLPIEEEGITYEQAKQYFASIVIEYPAEFIRVVTSEAMNSAMGGNDGYAEFAKQLLNSEGLKEKAEAMKQFKDWDDENSGVEVEDVASVIVAKNEIQGIIDKVKEEQVSIKPEADDTNAEGYMKTASDLCATYMTGSGDYRVMAILAEVKKVLNDRSLGVSKRIEILGKITESKAVANVMKNASFGQRFVNFFKNIVAGDFKAAFTSAEKIRSDLKKIVGQVKEKDKDVSKKPDSKQTLQLGNTESPTSVINKLKSSNGAKKSFLDDITNIALRESLRKNSYVEIKIRNPMAEGVAEINEAFNEGNLGKLKSNLEIYFALDKEEVKAVVNDIDVANSLRTAAELEKKPPLQKTPSAEVVVSPLWVQHRVDANRNEDIDKPHP